MLLLIDTDITDLPILLYRMAILAKEQARTKIPEPLAANMCPAVFVMPVGVAKYLCFCLFCIVRNIFFCFYLAQIEEHR